MQYKMENWSISKEAIDKIDSNNNPSKLQDKSQILDTDFNFKHKIVWFNAIGFAMLHLGAVVGLYLQLTRGRMFTFLWTVFLIMCSGIGVVVGSHRLWSHRAMKATLSARLTLLVLQTIAGQNCLWVWVRDHRQHHKFADTDADPHNATRGFFFSHIGWLMCRKHPLVIDMGKTIKMKDLEEDPYIMFQKRYYKTLYFIFAFAIPVTIPIYAWKEHMMISFFVCLIARQVILLHMTWSVNSIAHLYGTKPYDKNILAMDSIPVAMISGGEGWHNYHHVFPWDYRAAEYGRQFQFMTSVIHFCEKFGLFYDLREASAKRILECKMKNLERAT